MGALSILGINMAATLHTLSSTIDKIEIHIEQTQSDWMRAHCGASGIGKECERAVYYGFRWFSKPDFEGRLLRLFRRGHGEEPIWFDDLKAIGVEVSEGPREGEQWRFSVLDGHFAGSADAVIKGLPECPDRWLLAEVKTMNKKSFDHLLKHGLRASKPVHYSQMQSYMHNLKPKLSGAAYLVTCKDDDRRHASLVPYDQEHAESLLKRAERVIFAKTPPPRLSERPDFYLCKWCDHYQVCHQHAAPEKNCRTCTHSNPVSAGNWQCAKTNDLIQIGTQKTGCSDYYQKG